MNTHIRKMLRTRNNRRANAVIQPNWFHRNGIQFSNRHNQAKEVPCKEVPCKEVPFITMEVWSCDDLASKIKPV